MKVTQLQKGNSIFYVYDSHPTRTRYDKFMLNELPLLKFDEELVRKILHKYTHLMILKNEATKEILMVIARGFDYSMKFSGYRFHKIV
jgi:hypothetical protein